MHTIINSLFILFFFLAGTISSSEFSPVENEFLSPEHLFYEQANDQIYIGLSSYPGVALLNTKSARISEILPMPTPVKGVIVDRNGNSLYAAAGEHQTCLYVYDLHAKKLRKSIKTGSGPTDIAHSLGSNLLFVSNRFSNDISVIDIHKSKEIKRINASREPVAISLSRNEKILAVANLLPIQASIEKYVSAYVTLIDSKKLEVIKNIELPNGTYRLKDVQFSRSNKYLYISHLIGRYNVLTSQIEKGWINTNAISIIDVQSQEYYTTVLLDDIHNGAANPYGLDISEDDKFLFVAISGTDELFVIDREGLHQNIEQSKQYDAISQSTNLISDSKDKIRLFEHPDDFEPMRILFKDIPQELGFLAPIRKRVKLKGFGPAHIVSDKNKLYISDYFSDVIELYDLDNFDHSRIVEIGIKDISSSNIRYGEMLFHSAQNCFQQWQSCASCHPGNGRVDGLNWDLMNDGIGNPKNTKSLLFSHETPPVMATGIRHNAETGVRAGFKFIQFFNVSDKDAEAVDSYLRSLKPIPSPYLENGNLSAAAKRGMKIFEEMGCASCHAGQHFTDMQQHDMENKGKYDKQTSWDTPTLIELWRSAPYMHDGRYYDLKDAFKIEMHGLQEEMSSLEIEDLTNYLMTL